MQSKVLRVNQLEKTNLIIEWTTAYDLFRLVAGQRRLRPKHVENLRAKIRQHGFLSDHPIVCYLEGDYFYITDGQHRFEAAKEEGIAVPVLILPKDQARLRLELNNTTTKAWNAGDSLNFYVESKVKDYELIQLFMSKYNLPLTATLRLVGGFFTSEPKKLLHDFRDGTFRANLNTLTFAHSMAVQMEEIRNLHESYGVFRTDRSFMRALIRTLAYPGYDHQRMMQKLSNARTMLCKCATLSKYLELFSHIYNRGLSSKKQRTFFEVEPLVHVS